MTHVEDSNSKQKATVCCGILAAMNVKAIIAPHKIAKCYQQLEIVKALAICNAVMERTNSATITKVPCIYMEPFITRFPEGLMGSYRKGSFPPTAETQ